MKIRNLRLNKKLTEVLDPFLTHFNSIMENVWQYTNCFFPSGENKTIWKRFNSKPSLIRFALLALVSRYTQSALFLLQVELFASRGKLSLPLRNLQSEQKLLWCKLWEAIFETLSHRHCYFKHFSVCPSCFITFLICLVISEELFCLLY